MPPSLSNPPVGEVNGMERTHLPTRLSALAQEEKIIEQILNHREHRSRIQWDNDHFVPSWTAAGEAEELAPLMSPNCHIWMPSWPGLSSINRNEFFCSFKGRLLCRLSRSLPLLPFCLISFLSGHTCLVWASDVWLSVVLCCVRCVVFLLSRVWSKAGVCMAEAGLRGAFRTACRGLAGDAHMLQ